MPLCSGLFADGLQAANNVYFAICGSMLAATPLTLTGHQRQHLCLQVAAGRSP